MRVLLTGGAGFIGSALSRRFLREGWDLVVLDRLTYAADEGYLAGLPLRLVVGDVCDTAMVTDLASECDVVVHLAAESHVERAFHHPDDFLHTNILGTLSILRAAVATGRPVFHVSTDEVFGTAPEGTEFLPTDRLVPGNFYAATKASGEAFVHHFRHAHRLPAVVIRTTNNYGPRQHVEKAIPSWIMAALDGLPLHVHGDGGAARNWLFVEDFTDGLTRLVATGVQNGEFHFRGDHLVTVREVAGKVAAICGSPSELVHVAERPGQDRRYSIHDTVTRELLGWKPMTSLDDGLRITIDWYRGRRSRAVGKSLPG